jgi:hypothetical protein
MNKARVIDAMRVDRPIAIMPGLAALLFVWVLLISAASWWFGYGFGYQTALQC